MNCEQKIAGFVGYCHEDKELVGQDFFFFSIVKNTTMSQYLKNIAEKLFVTEADEQTGKKSVRLTATGSGTIVHLLTMILALYVSIGRHNGFDLMTFLLIVFVPVIGPIVYLFWAVLDTMEKYPGDLLDSVTFKNLVNYKETASSEEFLKNAVSMLSNLTALDTL